MHARSTGRDARLHLKCPPSYTKPCSATLKKPTGGGGGQGWARRGGWAGRPTDDGGSAAPHTKCDQGRSANSTGQWGETVPPPHSTRVGAQGRAPQLYNCAKGCKQPARQGTRHARATRPQGGRCWAFPAHPALQQAEHLPSLAATRVRSRCDAEAVGTYTALPTMPRAARVLRATRSGSPQVLAATTVAGSIAPTRARCWVLAPAWVPDSAPRCAAATCTQQTAGSSDSKWGPQWVTNKGRVAAPPGSSPMSHRVSKFSVMVWNRAVIAGAGGATASPPPWPLCAPPVLCLLCRAMVSLSSHRPRMQTGT